MVNLWIDNEIISAMNEYKAMPNCYVMISKKINKGFSPKQIRQRWISQLDPRLCQWPLDNNEKFYIIHWVEGYKIKNPSKNINWKELIFEMEKKFDFICLNIKCNPSKKSKEVGKENKRAKEKEEVSLEKRFLKNIVITGTAVIKMLIM
ncbi:hypothetical protein RhiirC2_867499 [Rhizophagus irregularis]|uniref:HTH myb-type domain-containing protein n=1 Tax=Rhizophagus irregularis TaxID=588596 RepID=A0A2N1N2G2_9GLOM|nr:hypothetical protein RhiirC2_867499 [Rhizophagus irregularis]